MPASEPQGPLPAIRGYRILRLLGEGGMGRVYLAEDEALGRPVAIKEISGRFAGRPEARARFLREARSMATVEHTSVVRVYSFGESDESAYFVMEYVDGESLSERIRRSGPLPPAEVARLLVEIVDGLEAAWEKGVVHRDVKPGNVLLDSRGRARVADFGLAKPVRDEAGSDPALTQAGSILGTPYYVSPEQVRGRPADFRSDVYSLGIVAFEMLTGARPFTGSTSFEVTAKHLHEPLPELRARRPDVPEALARAITWMTAKDPAQRPTSYAALRQALAPLSAPDTLESSPTASFVSPSAFPPARGRYRLRLALGLVLLAIAGLAVALRVRSKSTPSGQAASQQLVVAIAPFYGPDEDSAKEGRMMAALVEREIGRRLGADGARVIGVDETQKPVRDHAAARALGERLSASVVVWGESFAVRGETEIQPYFTMVPKPQPKSAEPVKPNLEQADPFAAVRETTAATTVVASQAANQVELRRTSAGGVSDLVLMLAGMNALYTENDARKAISLFERAPRSAQSLRHRAQALRRLGRGQEAIAALQQAVGLEPADAQTHASLGDTLIEQDRLADAARELQRAAEIGGTYTTERGIWFEGKLYIRESYHSPVDSYTVDGKSVLGAPRDSGYLLAVAPDTGSVLERHRLPGFRSPSLAVRDGVLQIGYADPYPATATFRNGRYEKPLSYGGNMWLRRSGLNVGATLSLALFTQTGPRKSPWTLAWWAPATLPDLEKQLRAAIARDPTQPWHLVYLGAALQAQGRVEESRGAWQEAFSGEFPAIPYYEYSWMALLLESVGEREWADRAYAEALARRRRLPQPIEASLLMERAMNAPFARAETTKTDRERAYTWLLRGRELLGLTLEGEELAAAAWSADFRRRGDEARARHEDEVLAAARRQVGNILALTARFDVALQLFLTASFGFLGLAVLRLRYRAVGGGLVAGQPWRSRATLLGAGILALGLAWPVLHTAHRAAALGSSPIALADSMGSAENVIELEKRLSMLPTTPGRFAAAVANHLAGNTDRARELYQGLGEDPRARRNLEALQASNLTPPEPLRAEDYVRAYLARPALVQGPPGLLHEIAGNEAVPLGRVIAVTLLLDVALVSLLALSFWRVPHRPQPGRAPRPMPRWIEALLVGAADLRRGRDGTAWITLCLAAFFALVVSVQLGFRSDLPVPGPLSAVTQIGLRTFSLPLAGTVDAAAPEAERQWARAHYRDFLRARPEVPALWIAAALAGLVALGLHVRALRCRVGDSPPPAPTAPSVEEAETAISSPRSPTPPASARRPPPPRPSSG